MSRQMLRKIIFTILISSSIVFSDGHLKQHEKPFKIFFDQGGSVFNYLQTDVNWVDIVRDPKLAEIYILLNSVASGGGGREYTITFIGQNGFAGLDDTLKYSFPQNVSVDERNEQLVRLIKVGLARYVAETPYSKFLSIDFDRVFDETKIEDDWDGWVFSVGVDGSFRGEESQEELYWQLSGDIDRVKEETKLMINARMSNELDIYRSDEGESSSSTRNRLLNLMHVWSVTDHFSAGFFTGANNSTYDNLKLSYNFYPAIEYNVFPYRLAARKTFSFLYRIGYVHNDYYNRTIFMKEKEDLFKQSLSIGYRMNETWGEAHFYLTAANYLHDFDKNKLNLWSRLAYKLTGSLSFTVQAEVSYINDQLHLEQEGATLEEILLNQKSLSTNYQYRFRLGFKYTFGSIYNNIVNTRF